MTDLPEYPLVTFALFAYNQEKYIREAVEGALEQNYPNLEIIISDDFSTDRTYEIVQTLAAQYQGPHSVRINRNTRNMGIGAHADEIVRMSAGSYIFAAAGDDISESNRVEICLKFLLEQGVYAVTTDESHQTSEGDLIGLHRREHMRELTLADVIRNRYSLGCTEVWSRELFTRFAPMDEAVVNEDVVMAVRALLLGKIEYVPLATVRRTVGIGVSERKQDASIRSKALYHKAQLALWRTVRRDLYDFGRHGAFPEVERRMRHHDLGVRLYEEGSLIAAFTLLGSMSGCREVAKWAICRVSRGN